MSVPATQQFREAVSENVALRNEFVVAFAKGPDAVVAVAQRAGYSFTADEYTEELDRIEASGELKDEELELVSAGSSCGDNSNGGQGSNGKS